MEALLIIISLFIFFAVIFYILYINGFAVIKSVTCIKCLAPIGKYNSKVSVLKCDGYIKRIIKFKESRKYHFNFNCNISNGYISAKVENKFGESLLELDSNNRNDTLDVKSFERYYLILSFKKADGDVEIKWS